MTESLFEECIARIKKGDQEGLKVIYDAYLSYIYSIVFNVLRNKEDAEDVTSDFFLRIWYTADKFKKGRGHKAYLGTIARNMCIDYMRKHGREIPSDLWGGNEAAENENYQRSKGASGLKLYDGSDSDKKKNTEAGKVVGISERAQQDAEQGFEDRVVESMTLREALEKLSSDEREVINLKIGADMTFKEISRVLDMPLGTVSWRYREAIEKLRRYGFDDGSGK